MEMIDTRNEQTVEIERLNERIAEHQRLLRSQDGSINNLLRSFKYKDDIIREQRCVIAAMDGSRDEKDQEISKQREVIERFELTESTVVGNLRRINTQLHKTNGDLENRNSDIHVEWTARCKKLETDLKCVTDFRDVNTKLHKTIRSQDDTICGMVDEIDKLEFANEAGHSIIRDWTQQNDNLILSAEVRDYQIEELECKLADREKQFNELDGVLVRTRDAFLAAKDCVYLQKGEIKELKADIAEKTIRNNDLIKQYYLDQKTIEKLDNQTDELNKTVSMYERASRKEAMNMIGTKCRNAEIADRAHSLEAEREVDHDAIRTLNQHIIGLEAELSTRKEDLKSLIKVVETIKAYNCSNERPSTMWAFDKIAKIVEDYLGAQEDDSNE